MAGLGLGLEGLNLAAKVGRARAVLAKVPPKVWYALAIAAALVAAFFVHQHYAHKAINAAYQQGKADEAARVAKQAAALKLKIDTLTGRISITLRTKTDEENRRIAADAGTLRLQGPGRAVCPRLPSAAGGYGAGAPEPDAAGPALPPDDRAAVPWSWLVGRGQEHDELLAEVKAWRGWHDEVLKVWPSGAKPAGQ